MKTLSSRTYLYKVDRALLNMNSRIFFRRMAAVLTVKTQRKCISSHLKNGNPIKPTRLRANEFRYLDFRSHRKADYPKYRFHLLLKVLLHSKFTAKSTYRLIKRLQKYQPDRNITKARHSWVLPGNTKYSVTSQTR